MKKSLICAFALTACTFLSSNLFAQKPEEQKKKSEEIIIRKNGDENKKMTIVVDGDNVTVNGKPLSDYHNGDVTIMKKDNDILLRSPGDFTFTPGNENHDFQLFNDDRSNAKPRTFLGVETQKTDEGVKITDVIKQSAAEKAGLQNGDIITKLNDTKIESPEDLMEAVRLHKPDDDVKIYYSRDGKKKNAKVKLGETKEYNNNFIFKNDNPNAYNFKMPRMPRIERLPNTNYNFNWNSNTPKLGLKVQDTEDGKGVKVLSVESGSAAEKAGLQKDDIITKVNGEDVNDVNDVREQLNELNDNDNFKVEAKRNNSTMNLDVKIPKNLNSADL